MDEIDFGTLQGESFEAYIERVGNLIDSFKITRGGEMNPYLQGIIFGIFRDTCTNPSASKFQGLYNLLKKNLKREPIMQDVVLIENLVRDRLAAKLPKQLYGKEIQ